MMGPTPAGAANVEKVLKENIGRTVHRHRRCVSGLNTRVKRVDVSAEFIRRVPAGIISGRVRNRAEGVVLVDERRGARAPVLLRGGQGTEVKGPGGSDHVFQGGAETEIEGANQVVAAALAGVDRVHPGVHL